MARKKTCPNHPDREAEKLCMGCGKYFCKACVQLVFNVAFCADCQDAAEGLQAAMRGAGAQAPPPEIEQPSAPAPTPVPVKPAAQPIPVAPPEPPPQEASPRAAKPVERKSRPARPKREAKKSAPRALSGASRMGAWLLGLSLLLGLACYLTIRSQGPWEYAFLFDLGLRKPVQGGVATVEVSSDKPRRSFGGDPYGYLNKKGTYYFDRQGRPETGAFGPVYEMSRFCILYIVPVSGGLGLLLLLPFHASYRPMKRPARVAAPVSSAPESGVAPARSPRRPISLPRINLPAIPLKRIGFIVFVLGTLLFAGWVVLKAYRMRSDSLNRAAVEARYGLSEQTQDALRSFYASLRNDRDYNSTSLSALEGMDKAEQVGELRGCLNYLHNFIQTHANAHSLGWSNHGRLKDAAEILGVIGEPRSKESLEILLDYPKRGVRAEAKLALARIKRKASSPNIALRKPSSSPSFLERLAGISKWKNPGLSVTSDGDGVPVVHFPLKIKDKPASGENLQLFILIAPANTAPMDGTLVSRLSGKFEMVVRKTGSDEWQGFSWGAFQERTGYIFMVYDHDDEIFRHRSRYSFRLDSLEESDWRRLGGEAQVSAAVALCKEQGWEIGFQRFVTPVLTTRFATPTR